MILVTGSLAYDKICDFDGEFKDHILPNKIDSLSVVFTLKKCRTEFGGTAGNIAYNLAILNENPFLLSNAGGDFEIYKKHLEKSGVNLDFLKIFENEKTAECTIINDNKNNQIGTFYNGALSHQIKFSRLKNKNLKINAAIVSPTDISSMINAADFFQKNKNQYIFDPGQQIGNFKKDVFLKCIKGSYLSIFNEYEWDMAKKIFSINRDKVLSWADNLIVTLGENGSVLFTSKKEFHVPAIVSKKVIDTTGCGDAYRAGLLYGMKNKWELEKSCKLGSKLASKVLEHFGTQNHSLKNDEKTNFLKF